MQRQNRPYPGYLAGTEIAGWFSFFGLCLILPVYILIPLSGFMVLSFSIAYLFMRLDPDEIVFGEYDRHFEPDYRTDRQVSKTAGPWGDVETVKPKPAQTKQATEDDQEIGVTGEWTIIKHTKIKDNATD